jgi:hypothetical protein
MSCRRDADVAASCHARSANGIARIDFLGLERRLEMFLQGMRDLGNVEGRDILVEDRPSDLRGSAAPASLPTSSR